MSSKKKPNFQQIQHQFTAYLRDPLHNPAPTDIPLDRLTVYRDLVFNNINDVLKRGFPVLHSITPEKVWDMMVQDFIKIHTSESPFFTEIPEEFIAYIKEERKERSDPDFLLELAHYEWIELALELSDIIIDSKDETDNLLDSHPIVSPLAWLLQYQYPVHKITKNNLPKNFEKEQTYLVAYRNRNYKIDFLEISTITAKLIELLRDNPKMTSREALNDIAKEINHPHSEELIQDGLNILEQLKELDIILSIERTHKEDEK